MQFNEWVETQNGLFEEIENILELPFDTPATSLDVVYTALYGRKLVPANIIELSTKEVANIILVSYGDKWIKQYDLQENEVILGVDRRITTDETIENTKDRNSTNTRLNKVSAFNDDELVVDEGVEDETEDTSNDSRIRNLDRKEYSMKSIERQMILLENSFIRNIVFEDVKKVVALSIY